MALDRLFSFVADVFTGNNRAPLTESDVRCELGKLWSKYLHSKRSIDHQRAFSEFSAEASKYGKVEVRGANVFVYYMNTSLCFVTPDDPIKSIGSMSSIAVDD